MSTDHQDENRGSGNPPEEVLRASELSYCRLFEAAQDGILILELETGRITDVNPFLFHLLGFSLIEMVGKTVGELSPFKDIESNKVMLERLQRHGYVRYEDLPLKTSDGRDIAVEFGQLKLYQQYENILLPYKHSGMVCSFVRTFSYLIGSSRRPNFTVPSYFSWMGHLQSTLGQTITHRVFTP